MTKTISDIAQEGLERKLLESNEEYLEEGLKTTSGPESHYQCKICGGNPTGFPYKPDRDAMNFSGNRKKPSLKTGDIIISFEFPPIPDRSHDYRAYYKGREEDGKDGFGMNPMLALNDLIENYLDFSGND
jgi:hypothetical protein